MDFFYNSICHVCKHPKSDLKRCSSCKFIAYCSKEHQVSDWKNHKEICKLLAESGNFVKLEKGCGYDRWRSYRTYLQFFLEQRLQRELLPYESQMWMFPRHCAVCYSTENLKDCQECFCVAYCSLEHRSINEGIHKKYCTNLKLCRELDCFYSKLPKVEIFVKEIEANVKSMPDNIQEMAEICLNTSKCDNILEKMYTIDIFANILTILHGLEICGIIHERMVNDKLVIHLVGADINEVSVNWEHNAKLLKTWMKNLKSCKIILIGPDCVLNHSSEIHSCDEIKVECYNDFYHNAVDKIDAPDLIVALNSGIHEFEFNEKEDKWSMSLSKLINKAPLLLTAYTREELVKDLQRIEVFNIKKILDLTRNPFSNLRPIRDWDSRDNEPFYVNGYIAIITHCEEIE